MRRVLRRAVSVGAELLAGLAVTLGIALLTGGLLGVVYFVATLVLG